MKRSEMVKLLERNFGAIGFLILDVVEQAGMLPPSSEWLIENTPELMRWSEVADYHNWDPEEDDLYVGPY